MAKSLSGRNPPVLTVSSGQSYKRSTMLIYNARVVLFANLSCFFCLKIFSFVLSKCFDRRSYDDLKFVYDISTMKEKANFFAKVGSKFFVVRCNFRTVRSHHDDDYQIWQNFITLGLGQLVQGLLSIWENLELTLANLFCFWTNFHGCKWPNVEKVI